MVDFHGQIIGATKEQKMLENVGKCWKVLEKAFIQVLIMNKKKKTVDNQAFRS